MNREFPFSAIIQVDGYLDGVGAVLHLPIKPELHDPIILASADAWMRYCQGLTYVTSSGIAVELVRVEYGKDRFFVFARTLEALDKALEAFPRDTLHVIDLPQA